MAGDEVTSLDPQPGAAASRRLWLHIGRGEWRLRKCFTTQMERAGMECARSIRGSRANRVAELFLR